MTPVTRRAALCAGVALVLPGAASELGDAPAPLLLLRHALAPGTGDPAHFQLRDCRTQRNLSAEGRAQAVRIGRTLAGIPVGAVWASPWCRTRDTAELAFPGRWVEEPAFASFFEAPEREAAQTAAALERLRLWRGPGVLVVVTHQVNITALLGVAPAQAGGAWARFDGDGRLQRVARFELPSAGP